MKVLQQYEFLKTIYADVITGRSRCEKYSCFVKHLTELDYAELIRSKRQYIQELKRQGVPSEAERLSSLKEQGLWTDKDEDDLRTLRLVISDNTKLVERIMVPSQRAPIESIISQKRLELSSMSEKRAELIQSTVEQHGTRHYAALFPKMSMFKDAALSIPRFSAEEYDEMDDSDLVEIHSEYSLAVQDYSEYNFRALACMPFVLNQISSCKKNLYNYLGKPIVNFTIYQQDILNRTLRNLSVIENSESEPIEIEEETVLQDVIDWYDLNFSILLSKRQSSSQDTGVKTSKNYVNNKK